MNTICALNIDAICERPKNQKPEKSGNPGWLKKLRIHTVENSIYELQNKSQNSQWFSKKGSEESDAPMAFLADRIAFFCVEMKNRTAVQPSQFSKMQKFLGKGDKGLCPLIGQAAANQWVRPSQLHPDIRSAKLQSRNRLLQQQPKLRPRKSISENHGCR